MSDLIVVPLKPTLKKARCVRARSSRRKHKGSVVSTRTVDSLSADERQGWAAFRKELENIETSVAAFEANKDFIVNWIKTAISTRAFGE